VTHLSNPKQSFLITLLAVSLLSSLTYCSDPKEGLDAQVGKVSNPKTTRNSWIQDGTGVLKNSQTIDNLISENESKTGVEIAVVILPTIDSYVPKDFAVALFNHFGIGKKDKNNGILILHVLDQRRVEIEVGYGLEGDLPDVIVKRIIDTYTIPAFKADDFSKGHLDTVTALISKLNHPEMDFSQLVPNNEASQVETPNAEVEIPVQARTDLYDYKGKSFSQLTEEEKTKLDASIEKYNTTGNYFLTDEESRLYSERTAEKEAIEKKKEFEFKMYLGLGYLAIIAGLFLLQQILYWIIPSPKFKYQLVRYTDFSIFYGLLTVPLLIFILLLTHFFDENGFPVSMFLSVGSCVIYNLFWGDLRLKLLSPRLLKIRSIPRKCPDCKQTMIKLSEKEDNAHLSKGQIAEEIVKSIDYDVWICPACNANEILPFPNIDPDYIFKGTSFKKVKQCPECKFQTFVHKSSRIISNATYSSSGKVEVKRTCEHCKHTDTEFETIPKKQKSSSGGGSSGGGGGGGGSFGGGSSGGGGSGGSY
jgi:uncharacterized protein